MTSERRITWSSVQRCARIAAASMIAGIAHTPASAQPSSVVGGPHNLSVFGPGSIKAASESEVCIFCHAPHRSTPIKPLWNRTLPTEAYLIYNSRALDARPGQPTGSSKMCLSCHDGTIALGTLVSRDMPVAMAGGVASIPTGHSRIGTDLRDDHPISFAFDASLASRDPRLKSPGMLPSELKLDANQELQCTTCHEAHDNARGNFLVMDNVGSQLCTSCHSMGTTSVSQHQSCNACHQPHTAPSGPYLLRAATITDTCLRCHDGSVPGAANIHDDLKKSSTHDTKSPIDPPDPQRDHATCTSCHEPHTMTHGETRAPALRANAGHLPGVNASGAPVASAAVEAEGCFRCHADGNSRRPIVSRRLPQNNTRLEFAPDAVSSHPVLASGRNADVPSLLPPYSVSSVIYCSDCHASDTGVSAGASGPSGTHGSIYAPLLSARYETFDNTPESAAAYALCYRCHDRANILSDASFKGHKKHIVDQRTPCSACHDAHGIASVQGNAINNSNLINFDTKIVQPEPTAGRIEFRDTGVFRGECTVRCHGASHVGMQYGN